MEKVQLPDLIISGVSDGAGGSYDSISIDGVGKVIGPLVARIFKGNGHIRLRSDLTAGEMECNGTMNVKGYLQVGEMKVDGMLNIGENLRGESCTLNGLMSIKGNCEFEDFAGGGAFTVGGLLSAGHMNFELHGQGKANEIGVESLIIRQANKGAWSKLWGGIIPKFRSELSARTIEGDYIDLESTTADIVRGNVVIIGQGCSIGRVEYRSQLTIHPGARVGKEEKIGD